MPKRPPVHKPMHYKPHAERNKEYDARRGSRHERNYNSRWVKAREAWLRKYPLCKECERHGYITAATVVDHIMPHRGDKVLFWDKTNWQSLCKTHHDEKTAKGL